MAVSFANLFIAVVETEILNASTKQKKHLCGKVISMMCSLFETNLKKVLMSKWHLIQNHPLLSEVYKDSPIISCRRGKSLKDVLVRSKL